MSHSIKNFLEAVKAVVLGKGVVVFPEGNYSGKHYPTPGFDAMGDLYLGDTDVSSSIDFIAGVVAGNRFETEMNPKYQERSADNKTAKEIVDGKNKIFHTDELAQEVSRDLVGYGNSVIWKGSAAKSPQFLLRIPPATIRQFSFDPETNLKLQSVETAYTSFSADELWWLSFNHIGKSSLGVGMLELMLTPLDTGDGGQRPPIAHIKARLQKSMMEQIEKFSQYNEMWKFPGLADDKTVELSKKIQTMSKSGQRLTTNVEGGVIPSVPERMRGLDFYVETLMNSYFLGLKTPFPKLILGGSFTEAAAQAAAAIGERSTSPLQSYIKRVFESELFDVWVAEAGLDPVQAAVRLNWRQVYRPDINVLLPVLEKSREFKDVSREEWRNFLRNLGLPIEPEYVPDIPSAPVVSPAKDELAAPPNPDQPILSALKKHEANPKEVE
jgi:hypothetical protein